MSITKEVTLEIMSSLHEIDEKLVITRDRHGGVGDFMLPYIDTNCLIRKVRNRTFFYLTVRNKRHPSLNDHIDFRFIISLEDPAFDPSEFAADIAKVLYVANKFNLKPPKHLELDPEIRLRKSKNTKAVIDLLNEIEKKGGLLGAYNTQGYGKLVQVSKFLDMFNKRIKRLNEIILKESWVQARREMVIKSHKIWKDSIIAVDVKREASVLSNSSWIPIGDDVEKTSEIFER